MNKVYNYQKQDYEYVQEDLVVPGITSGLYGFESGNPMEVLDPEGNLIGLDPQEALQLLGDDTSGYNFYSTEQRQADEARERATTPEQKVISGLEGLARGLTLGGSDILTTSLGLTEPDEVTAREKYNSGLALAGEVLGTVAPFIASGGSSALAKGISKAGSGVLMTDRLGVQASKAVLGASKYLKTGKTGAKAAEWGVRGSVEGAVYGFMDKVREQHLGDTEFNAEAILANVANNALMAGTLGSIVGIGGEAAGKALKSSLGKFDSRIDDFFRKHYKDTKITDVDGGDYPKIKPKILDGFSDNEAVEFKRRTLGEIRSIDGVPSTQYPDDGMVVYHNNKLQTYITEDDIKGATDLNLFRADDPIQLGEIKHLLKDDYLSTPIDPGTSLSSIIQDKAPVGKRAGVSEKARASYNSSARAASASSSRLKRLRDKREGLLQKLSEEAPESRRAASIAKEVDTYSNHIKNELNKYNRHLKIMRDKGSRLYGTNYKRNHIEFSDYLKTKDGISIGDSLYITNPNKLPRNVAFSIGKQKISASQDAVLGLIGVSKSSRKKMFFKDAVLMKKAVSEIMEEMKGEGMLSQISLSMKKARGRHEIFLEKTAAKISLANSKMERAITAAENTIPDVRFLKTPNEIADILKVKLEEKLLPKHVATAMEHKERRAILEEIDGWLELGRQNKNQPLSIREIRDKSILAGKEGYEKYNPMSPSYLSIHPKIARTTRDVLEDIVVQGLSPSKRVKGLYLSGKESYRKFVGVNTTLADNLSGRVNDKGFSLPFRGTAIGVGASALSSPIVGAGFFVANMALERSTPYLKAQFALKMSGRAKKWKTAIDNSAKGFFSSTGGATRQTAISQLDKTDLDLIGYGEVEVMAESERFQKDNTSFMDFAPETSSHLVSNFAKLKEGVIDSRPKQKEPLRGDIISEVPSYETRRAQARLDLSRNPEKILEQVNRGFITQDAAQILKEAFPASHRELYNSIMNEAKDGYFTPRQKMEMKKLFGGEGMDASIRPLGFNILQQLIAPIPEGEEEVQESPSHSRRPFRKRTLQETTDSERRSIR